MKTKIIILVHLFFLVACAREIPEGYVKIKLSSPNLPMNPSLIQKEGVQRKWKNGLGSLQNIFDQERWMTHTTECTIPRFEVKVLGPDVGPDNTFPIHSVINIDDFILQAEFTDLFPPFEKEILVKKGPNRTFTVRGIFYDDCDFATGLDAFLIYGEAGPYNIEGPRDISLEGHVYMGAAEDGFAYQPNHDPSDLIDIAGTDFVKMKFRAYYPTQCITPYILYKVIVRELDSGDEFEADYNAAMGADPIEFTIGPVFPRLYYRASLVCSGSPSVADIYFQAPAPGATNPVIQVDCSGGAVCN